MLVVYADETGTHGLRKGGKEPAPGVYGFMATDVQWDKFRDTWSAALKKHNAPYFHFKDLHSSSRKKKGTPYFGWSDSKVDEFKRDMAIAASCGPIPVGGYASVTALYGGRTDKQALHGSYEIAFKQFFEDFTLAMDAHFPEYKDTVAFVFDENDNEDWITILNKSIKRARKIDSRIGAFSSADDKTIVGMPCQAADLFASLNRKTTEIMFEENSHFPVRFFDFIIARHAYPKEHPLSLFAKFSTKEWEDLVNSLWAYKHLHESANTFSGIKKPFYPYRDHPYLKQIYQSLVTALKDYAKKHESKYAS